VTLPGTVRGACISYPLPWLLTDNNRSAEVEEPTVTARPGAVLPDHMLRRRNRMSTHISSPLNDATTQYSLGTEWHLDIAACPECSMTAALHEWDQIESTDGPVGHVRVTCVNRHWFLMPVDRLNEILQNSSESDHETR
jgi:hypothetical protein